MNKFDLRKMKLIVYDFDGVMTDNTVLVDQNGRESVVVNRLDGLAVTILKKLGIPQIIISTETNKIVRVRARKLKLPVIDSCSDKKIALIKYCRVKKIDLNKVLYIGNEINDLEAMKVVGFKICPQDAHKKIKEIVDIITETKGGYGVIRELIDILKIDG